MVFIGKKKSNGDLSPLALTFQIDDAENVTKVGV